MHRLSVSPVLRLAVVTALLACAGTPDAVDEPVPTASIRILAPTTEVMAGQTLQLQAVPMSASAKQLTARESQVTWSLSDPAVATISGAGVLTGLSGGQETVTAAQGGVSATTQVTVDNPAPQITALAPASVQAGTGQLTLKVTGTGFTTASRVRWNGADRATTVVGPTEVDAAIGAADVASAATIAVTVFSPTPGGGTSPALTFTVAPPSYTITTSANPAGGGSTAGGGTYQPGQQVTVTATPASGYSFVNWTEGGTPVSTSASYSFTASASRNLVANFQVIPTYTISTSSNPAAGGTTSGGGTYQAGQQVTVTATPASGYSFVNWTESGTAVSTSSSYGFTASAARSLVANFQVIPTYAISTSSNPAAGGSTSGGGTYQAGQQVTVTATPASGYSFVNWTEAGTVVSSSAGYAFTASASRTLVANFQAVAPTSYTISTSSNPAAGGSTSGAGNYQAGQQVTVTATPASGYSFVNWTEAGTAVSASAGYTFAVSGSRTLVANFQATVGAPVLSSLSPNLIASGGASATVRALGTGFTASSRVYLNGSPRPTTFVSASELDATLTTADVAAFAIYSMDVRTVLGSGTLVSNALSLVVDDRPFIDGGSQPMLISGLCPNGQADLFFYVFVTGHMDPVVPVPYSINLSFTPSFKSATLTGTVGYDGNLGRIIGDACFSFGADTFVTAAFQIQDPYGLWSNTLISGLSKPVGSSSAPGGVSGAAYPAKPARRPTGPRS